ncbi:MAG TPA: Rossmann-like and DUF2520 domain-containing protein [Terriglobales bacterium]|nr:Rossmann-like and DUF2520 domain-containing protein [Terriglobales bacterium]
MPRKKTIAIVGPGNLGSSLAVALSEAGYRIRELVIRDGSRSRRQAAALARRLGARLSAISQATLAAEVTWLCVSDDGIAALARQLARRNTWRGQIVLHSSGALSSEVLKPLQRAGAAVGSAHPMMTFVRGASPEWRGIPFAVEGDRRAVDFARRVARDLKLEPFVIPASSKVLYHAMGSFCSPLLITLLATAEEIARAAKIPPAKISKVMRPILEKTLTNYFANGAAAAFSGPMQRGDLATVKRHFENLRRVPGALEIYLPLALQAARRLPVANRAKLLRLVKKYQR